MILKGDCISVMKAMKPNSVDAIVCDPPYGLEFMGKEWDKLWDKREFGIDEYSKKSYTCSDGSTRKTNPVSRKLNNPNYKAGIEAQLWHIQWLTEAYRVLKPGGSMLVMGGTRTSHRLACAIEDSGFIIKDTLMWIYGSGFPKAQDLGKMIDKRARRQYVNVAIKLGLYIPENSKWDWTKGEHGISDKWWEKFKSFLSPEDWQKIEREIIGNGTSGKTAIWNEKGEMGDFDITNPSTDLAKHWDGFKVGGIKPAYEPIIWAVKPPEGSYVDNVLKHGVGAVNVDECRIGTGENKTNGGKSGDGWFGATKGIERPITKGRFPANVILSHHPECNEDCHPDCAVRLLDEQSGMSKSPSTYKRKADGLNQFSYSKGMGELSGKESLNFGDNGGASRFFYCAKASRGERNAGLEGMEEIRNHGHYAQDKWSRENMGNCPDNKREPVKNNHPTVKPIKLFEWLIKLVTREGQVILDPFIGSGTTAIATHNTGRKCVGIEKEKEYLEIAKRRIRYWENKPKQENLNYGELA